LLPGKLRNAVRASKIPYYARSQALFGLLFHDCPMGRSSINATCALALVVFLHSSSVLGQSVQGQMVEPRTEIRAKSTLQGIVRDSLNRPVTGATVRLQAKDEPALIGRSDSAGVYLFSDVRQGVYTLTAEMVGHGSTTSSTIIIGPERKTVDISLASATSPRNSTAAQVEFFDEPHFIVAGVTDTTSLGGHGSDTIVRNREALAQATASLGKQLPASSALDASRAMEQSLREVVARQPEDFGANFRLGKLLIDRAEPREALRYLETASRLNPADTNSTYELALAYVDIGEYTHARSHLQALFDHEKSAQQNADLHHLLADADEKFGDPVEAVREYQLAAELESSEANFFDWGAELLIHHAGEPAIEVFTKGTHLFPRSVRMLTGLGSAWYSRSSYDQAAQRFCEASDLNPNDPNPYLLMGTMQTVETARLPEIDERLARFVRLQPQNPWANYYYAVSLQKRWKSPEEIRTEDANQVQSLLTRAIRLDPKFGLAYLQLGILYSEQKELLRAIVALQEAVTATPELEQAHYRLALAYRQAGEISKANSELNLYEKISAEKVQETERRRHELQQFVYELRGQTPAPLK
jgi:tetratricopeptide (TPR) repeat protein